MDNSPVSDQTKQDVKSNYMILSGVLGVMTAGMWAVVGSAIHFTEGTSAYWGGACACAGMLFLSLLCSIRVYMNVEHFTTETKSNIKSMIDILSLVGFLTTLSCFAGFSVAINLGLVTYCSSVFNDVDCVNKEENEKIAPAMVAGCVISMFVTIGIQMVNGAARKKLKLNPVNRVGQMTVTFNQQQNYQNMTPAQGYIMGQLQTQSHPNSNPYPMPMQNKQGFQPTAPPPNYFAAASQPEYPPPQPVFPNQESGFSNQTQYSSFE